MSMRLCCRDMSKRPSRFNTLDACAGSQEVHRPLLQDASMRTTSLLAALLAVLLAVLATSFAADFVQHLPKHAAGMASVSMVKNVLGTPLKVRAQPR